MIWEGDRSGLATEAPVYGDGGSTLPVDDAISLLSMLLWEAFGKSQHWAEPGAWCRRCGCGQASRVASNGGTTRTTVGWSDCGHDAWRNGRVLDPFGGSGTTALVATGHGRDCLSIDLDARNADLAYERVGGLVLRDIGIDDVPGLLGAPTTEQAA